MKFGDKLIQLRKKKGLSQEELGEKLNVTRQTVSKWELGQTKPDTDKLMEISKLLNADFNQLADDSLLLADNNNIVSNEGISTDEVRPRKWLLILLIVIAITIVIVLATKFIGDMRTKAKEDNNSNIFDIFEEVNDTIIEDNEELQEDFFSDFEINRFNSTYEHLYAGTKYGHSVVNMLDEIITNNKTNSDRIIRVVYGTVNTIDENEIRNVKRGLDGWTQYEIIFDYDDIGFINQVTIEN